MAKPVTHFSKIRRYQGGMTVTGTLCNRMTSGEINCSADELDVTCKFCLPVIRGLERSFLVEHGVAA